MCLGGRLRGGMWRLWQHGGGVRSGESGWRGDGRRPNGGVVAAVRWGPWRAERERSTGDASTLVYYETRWWRVPARPITTAF